MKVQMIWSRCNLLNGHWCHKKRVDSFWVECTCEEAENLVLPFCKEEMEICCGSPNFHDGWKKSLIKEAIEETKQKIKENPEPLTEDKLLYFLISRDLASIQVMWWGYPYSGQWNGYSPFTAIKPEIIIGNLEEIKGIGLSLSEEKETATDVVLNCGAVFAALVLKADGESADHLMKNLSGKLVELSKKVINISVVSIKDVFDGYYSEDIEMFIGDLLMHGLAREGEVFRLTKEGRDVCKRFINEELGSENDKRRKAMGELLNLVGIPTVSVVK